MNENESWSLLERIEALEQEVQNLLGLTERLAGATARALRLTVEGMDEFHGRITDLEETE